MTTKQTPIQATSAADTDEAWAQMDRQVMREAKGRRIIREAMASGDPPVSVARGLRAELTIYIDQSTPLSEEALRVFEVMAEASGHPVREAAETLGIDLAAATMTDAGRLAWHYGTRLGDKHSAGQR